MFNTEYIFRRYTYLVTYVVNGEIKHKEFDTKGEAEAFRKETNGMIRVEPVR